jgi:hypothetical protein
MACHVPIVSEPLWAVNSRHSEPITVILNEAKNLRTSFFLRMIKKKQFIRVIRRAPYAIRDSCSKSFLGFFGSAMEHKSKIRT